MATVQLSDYEMIFDDGGLEEDGMGAATEEDFGDEVEVEGDVDVVVPVVVSDVLQPSNRLPNGVESRTSPHLHVSKPAISDSSTPTPSPFTTPLFEAGVDMDRGRLRARPEPKPTPAEVSEALAIVDQDILEHGRGPPKKRGRGRPKGSMKGKFES
jgi:hypothetical protein